MNVRCTRGLLSAASLALGLTLSSGAEAQTAIPESNGEGLDVHLFRPAIDSKGFFTVNGSDILGHLDWSLGLVIDYGRGLMRVQDVGQQSPQLVDNALNGGLHFNLGLLNHLVVGVEFTPTLMTGEAQVNPNGSGAVLPGQWGVNQLSAQYFPGRIAGHVKWRILRVEKGLGVALAAQMGGPIGNAPLNLAADPGFYYWPQLIVEKRFGPPAPGQFSIGLNGGFRGHTGQGTTLTLRDGTLTDGNRITYGLGLAYRVLDPLALVAETYGTFLLNDSSPDLKPSNEVVGGIKLFIERNSYLMLGAGPRYTKGFEAADVRAFIGFIFEPSIGDRDGDGIKDDLDKCPDDPEDFDGFQDEDGCPDPDNDNDGIPDINDRCPNEPEDRDGDQDDDGCPEGSDGDRDGDGILDSRDKCPDDPEDRDGFQDQDGCPDPDNDMDGIPDKQDQCPNDAEDKDGFQDQDGCPDPDNDRDGIPDAQDKCPNEPEVFNGFEDEDGCPDKGSVIIQDNNILILEKIKFKTNSAEILPESNKILDAVATTLVHHPEFLLVEIAGHADERGDDMYNLRLTQDRVNSVMAALVQRGVPKDHLRSKGYGEYCPEDPAHNNPAWEKNRRVEFKILKTKDGPTGVEIGCALAEKKGVHADPVP